MAQVIQSIFDFFAFIISYPWSLVVDLLDWFVNFVTVTIPTAVWRLVPDGVADFVSSLDTAEIQSMIDTVTWFIPFWAITVIYLNAYAMAGGIRLVRYIIGFIPTIEG